MRNELRVRYDVYAMSSDESMSIVSEREFSCLAEVQLAISRRLDDLADQGVEHNWRQRHWWMDLRIHKGDSPDFVSVRTELKLCGEGARPSFTLACEDRYVVFADGVFWKAAHGPGDFADVPELVVPWLALYVRLYKTGDYSGVSWFAAHGSGKCADVPELVATWLDLHLGTETKVRVRRPANPGGDPCVVLTTRPALLCEQEECVAPF